ncbi:MAG: argininosuccinate lyase [Defluviitaleaceae bacterium]|nr:argininosuccinate lyase [Defluviitaleaceae bacterium]MCL2262380.1 argininosuccinate lyase [Defluviitaleaceae bacterium]
MKLWGGRFTGEVNEAANSFHSSISFDKRLYKQDITGSMAHAEMLGKQGIIPNADSSAIVDALKGVLADIENGKLVFDSSAEDIHSFVEAELISRIGDAGRRLHTGRSRNDQVALDMRMYVKEEISALKKLLADLLRVLLALAKKHTKDIMPGYTHLQLAQPVTIAHHLMAYVQMFRRDYERLADCCKRVDVMPLGAGALAATTYPIDREFVAGKLNFAAVTANSMDAVSDRDFCIEFVSALSITMMHLSRFCEELIIWSSDSFGFVEMADAYSTGSSIMPQKKNPDMAELIRGKTGRVYGSLIALLTVMKGLPLAYNKDMQEDKEAVFDAADTATACLTVFSGMVETLTFKTQKMFDGAREGYTNATDVADWLVKNGTTFRDAHEITGRLVLYAIEKSTKLDDLTLDEYKNISPVFNETVFAAITAQACVNARNITGGPAESAVLAAIEEVEQFLVRE